MTTLAYHFHNGKTLRDGRPLPPIGKWLRHDGEVKLGESGLHASVRLLDALQYAPGVYVDIVRLGRVRETGVDKIAAKARMRVRTAVFPAARFAAEAVCLALWCAGLGAEPWAWELADAAESGDLGRINVAAGDAIEAAGGAVGGAARAAARAALEATVGGAAEEAADEAARAAIKAASWTSAWWAAEETAWAVAWEAARAALEARAVELAFGERNIR